MTIDGDVIVDKENAVEEELDGENIIMHCALHNDFERLSRFALLPFHWCCVFFMCYQFSHYMVVI